MKVLKVTSKNFYGDYEAKKKNTFSNIQVADFEMLVVWLFDLRAEKDNL